MSRKYVHAVALAVIVSPGLMSCGGAKSPGTLITPDTPATSQVSFVIESSKDNLAISPFIYGINFHDFSGRPANIPLTREGGNRWSAYNWENNASNAGTDWLNQNDGYLSDSDTPGVAVTDAIDAAFAHNAAALITIPMIGHVAADKSPDGDVNQTPNYLSTRFKLGKAAKGSAFTLTPSTSDDSVYQDEFVNFLDTKYPAARTSASKTILYSLDNEPDLWSLTHVRIHPSPATYAEMVSKTTEYAAAIKAVIPEAIVLGPVNYGWMGMVNLQDAPDANGRDFLDYFLQQMAAAQTSHGKRLLDVLDVHWYPEAQGNGTRITDANDGTAAAARLAAPRSLWDSTYTETSWITDCCSGGPINLLPRLKGKIADNYPGTKLSVSEYFYGGGMHISGAIAQADVLGIFGREGVFAATLWPMTNTFDFTKGGFEIYRNFDGANGSFGDTSVKVSNSDTAQTSVYASVDQNNANRMVVVLINRTASARTGGLQIWHSARFNTARIYQLTAANSAPQAAGTIQLNQTNALQYTMPAYSVTTLVLQP